MIKYKLRPHQKEACDAVVKALKKESRCHVVMACGTGKSFAALRIAESIGARVTLVLLPSLALISQLMKAWITQSQYEGIDYLAACSDNTVTRGLEEESVLTEDIDFPVCNNTAELKRFCKAGDGRDKIIFCTYQSSHILKGIRFGFAVFDEAHKTAGYDKTTFAFALKDENVKISKRLFMTATPRHGMSRKDKDGEFKVLYSMDDVSAYGRRVYTLGFREAIKLNLICDYKIIISLAKKGAPHDFNEEYEIQEKTIALQKAIKKTSAHKIITFHSSIKDARHFAEYLPTRLKKHTVSHVSARIPMNKRFEQMESFINNKNSLITISRCLTEGVDVPAVDMVAFLSPKSSKIDIVQAIGRALRKHPGKEKGYIFLPLLCDESQVGDADFSDYGPIWDVLSVLMGHDSDLADVVKNVARIGGKELEGRRSELFNHIQILNTNKKLEELIYIKVVNRLSSGWDQRYGELSTYKKKFGHVDVPEGHSGYATLHNWVLSNRKFYIDETLQKARIDLLNALGFDWSPLLTQWDKSFARAKAYYLKHGHLTVPNRRSASDEDKKLYKWCESQRRNFHLVRGSTMDPARLKKLESICFPFGKIYVQMKGYWSIRLAELIAEGKKAGNVNLKDSYLKTAKGRAGTHPCVQWIQKQRSNYLGGVMPKEKQALLEEAGVILDVFGHAWNTKHNSLCEEAKTGEISSQSRLWLRREHEKELQGGMCEERLKKLQMIYKLGVDPASRYIQRQTTLDSNIKCLLKFHKKNNHFGVSYLENVRLSNWVASMRLLYKRKTIPQANKDALNKIGFDWGGGYDFQFDKWKETYNEYKKYHPRFCLKAKERGVIPSKVKNFRSSMRSQLRGGKLRKNRKDLLNEIGFDWGRT